MKQVIKLTALFITVLMMANEVKCQSYNTAIGIRGGETAGLTFKQSLSSGKAFEGIIGFWPHGFSVTGLLEKVNETSVSGLNWYYGAGGHLSTFSSRRWYYRDHPYYYRRGYNYNYIGLGIDFIVGLEYKIPTIPFALSLDLKPYGEVSNYGHTYFSLDPGIGIKFTF